jgi:hypothetical protein
MWEDDAPQGRGGFINWPFSYLGPHAQGTRGGGVPPSQMRVSDAERNEIAEQLSKHFADGRLDQAELDERMGRAMSAKTRGDLAGLLDDLPPIAPPPPEPGAVPVQGAGSPPVRRGGFSTVLTVLLVALLLQAVIGAMFWHPLGLWVFILAFGVLMVHRSRRRYAGWGPYGPGPYGRGRRWGGGGWW